MEESGILEGDARNTPPLLKLPTPEQEEKLAQLKEDITRSAEVVKSTEAQLAAGQAAWENGLRASLGEPPVWSAARPVAVVSANLPEPVAAALRQPAADRSQVEADALAAYRRQQAPEMAAAVAAAERATRALGEWEASVPTAMVMKELAQPREARVLHRGEYDKPGDPVPRQLPAFLPALPASETNDRLGLARWLVSGSHPLTARVWVNRTWEKSTCRIHRA